MGLPHMWSLCQWLGASPAVLRTKTRTDKKLGVRNSVGTFVGFATYRNVYGAVILTGKDTHIVGNLQVVFDSLFMPLKISLLRIQDWRLCIRSWGELTIV